MFTSVFSRRSRLCLSILVYLTLVHQTQASDLDMLLKGGVTKDKPNIMFVYDTSGSLTGETYDLSEDGLGLGGVARPDGYIDESSIELWGVVFDDDDDDNAIYTRVQLSDFDSIVFNAPGLPNDGPTNSIQEGIINNFLNTEADDVFEFLGSGFSEPYRQISMKLTPTSNLYFFEQTSDFTLTNPAAFPDFDRVEIRYQERGVAARDLYEDMVKESIYIAQDLGGANIGIMFGMHNMDEREPTSQGEKEDLAASDNYNHIPETNGAYVHRYFTDVTTMADAGAFAARVHDQPLPFDNGWSPYAESLYSAKLVFAGERSPWDRGNIRNYEQKFINNTDVRIDMDGFYDSLDTNAYVGGNVSGPHKSIWDTNPCGDNHIIVVGDGKASYDWHANEYIINEIGLSLSDAPPLAQPDRGDPGNPDKFDNYHINTDQTLFDEYVQFIYDTDLDPTKPFKQNITTHMIDAKGDRDEVDSGVENGIGPGGGKYFYPDTLYEIRDALAEIIGDATEARLTGYRLEIPSLPNDPFAQGTDVYVSFFNAENGWQGNLKKFTLNPVNGKITTGPGGSEIFDSRGVIDLTTVKNGAWGSGNDDNPIFTGGIADQFDYGSTKRFVQADATGKLNSIRTNPGQVNGMSPGLGDFDLSSGDLRDVIRLMGGRDSIDFDGDGQTNDDFSQFGDSLRSKPEFFYYYRGSGSSSQARIFTANNRGYIHGFDTASGKEKWAVINEAFFPAIGAVYDADTSDKQYGYDGGIALMHIDLNADNDLLQSAGGSVDAGEFLMLFATARRGGELLTALDITNPERPRGNSNRTWQITDDSTGFSNLGQTWSTPTVAWVQKGKPSDKTSEPVIFMGGGYDDRYDDPTFSGTSAKGASIYMIDSKGNKKWAGGSDGTAIQHMDYPIVNDIVVFDNDSDGQVELFYALDIMGQIFRCDIDELGSTAGPNELPDNNDIACKRIAQLDPTRSRRFYSGLDGVTVVDNNGGIAKIALSTGSGDINTPEDTSVIDRFFTVFDVSPMAKPTTYLNVTQSDLANATATGVPRDYKGWFIDLNPGEKVLSTSKTLYYRKAFQTSYRDTSAVAASTCSVESGYSGRTFLLDVRDAKPVANLGGPDDRSVEVPISTALPSEPVFFVRRDGDQNVPSIRVGGVAPVDARAFPIVLKTNYSDEIYKD